MPVDLQLFINDSAFKSCLTFRDNHCKKDQKQRLPLLRARQSNKAD